MSPARTVAVVPAAGYGKRLGCRAKKPFVLLGSRPLVSYALKTIDGCESVDGIIIAAERHCIKDFERLVRRFKFKKVIDIVAGGKTRFQSVKNCLRRVPQFVDVVLIHDGARPFLEEWMITDSIRMAEKFGGCILAVPESDTVKLVDRNLFISRTLDRSKVYRAQTPQVFRRDLIQKAYGRATKKDITDDASLAEALGIKVKVLKGSCRNIKITTKEDLELAEVLL